MLVQDEKDKNLDLWDCICDHLKDHAWCALGNGDFYCGHGIMLDFPPEDNRHWLVKFFCLMWPDYSSMFASLKRGNELHVLRSVWESDDHKDIIDRLTTAINEYETRSTKNVSVILVDEIDYKSVMR